MNDTGRVREVYDVAYRRLVTQLYAVTGDLAEAQDVVQEAFVRALARPRHLAGVDNPEAWLRTVAVNLARRQWRRRLRLGHLLGQASRSDPPAPAELSDEVLTLTAALRRLNRGQREAIALHYLADMSVEDTAMALGISAGTVKSRLARGRARLAAVLGEPDPGSVSAPGAAADSHRKDRHV
ncbi:MAG TPA: SigE family RNA polymerase sigma factor [Cryptosporangiaceae bacterium]|nr:SigE family RNA polymerase sigma factor [Cryptosporangiaceae bacterium]